MNISDDNTNELDSYGVWVKNSNEGNGNSPENQEVNEEIAAEDSSLDIPDFDDSDFSDMFKDESQFSSDEIKEETFSDDLDSTLSTDELANITDMGNVSVEQIDAPENSDTDDFNFDEITSESPAEEAAADTSDDFSIEVDEMPSDSSNNNEETTLDDFDFGEIEHSAVDSATPSDDIFNSDEEITSEETVIEDTPVEETAGED